jgi:glycosyltransferase involved in cell wall biosynthesis
MFSLSIVAHMQNKKKISIIVPVFNEEANVGPLYEAVTDVMSTAADRYDWEFVFTDNHSSDQTYEKLRSLAARDSRVRVYRFTRNFGFQRSILSGYRLSLGDAAIQVDCDLQDPPALILDFLRQWEAGYMVVYGVRKFRPELWLKRLVRRVFYRIIDFLSEDYLPHDAGDFRLVDRRIIDVLQEYTNKEPYLRGYIASLGYKQIGLEYDRSERRHGEGSFSFWQLVKLAVDGIVSHSILPLRLASTIGVAIFCASFLAILAYVVLRVTEGPEVWPAGFATMVILLLFSMALNAILFGIMGEYIGRIYNQLIGQPLTIVERFIDPGAPYGGQETRGRVAGTPSGIAMPRQIEIENGPTVDEDRGL